MLRTSICAAIVAFGVSQPVLAGSVADPVIEAPVIVADATSSSSGKATVLFLALLLSVPVLTD